MTMQTYGLSPGRLEKFKGRALARAVPKECISRVGRQVPMPKNSSDTYVARRWLPYGGTASSQNTFFGNTTAIDRSNALVQAHQTQEGITALPDNITPVNVQVVLQQFSCLYGWTDKTADLYEDDVPVEMKTLVGERVTLVNEMNVFGSLKACTNQFYGGAGTSRATTNGKLTLPLLRRIARSMMAEHASMLTTMLKPTAEFGTSTVPGGYVVYLSTDLESDARDLPNFVPREKYPSGASALPDEIGACERFRFVTSPDFVPILDGGAAVASAPGLVSNLGSNIDVYQFIVLAEDAFSQIAVRGADAMSVTVLPTGQKSKSDPHGQRGYAGAIWWKAVMIENNGWMAVGNVGASQLA